MVVMRIVVTLPLVAVVAGSVTLLLNWNASEQGVEQQAVSLNSQATAIPDAAMSPTDARPRATAEEVREAAATRLQERADRKASSMRFHEAWKANSMCAGGLGPRDDAIERQVLEACRSGTISDAELAQLRTRTSPTPYIVFCGEVWPEETRRISCFDLEEGRVDSIAALTGLPNLVNLKLHASRVADLGPLAELEKLQSLSVYSESLEDVGPLTGLVNLHHLDLRGTAVRDIGPLEALHNLRVLRVKGLDIPQGQIRSIQSAVPKLKVIGP